MVKKEIEKEKRVKREQVDSVQRRNDSEKERQRLCEVPQQALDLCNYMSSSSVF